MLPIHNLNAIVAEDVEHLEEMRQYNIQRRNLRDRSNPFEINETYFIDMFRLNKVMAQYVFDRINVHMVARENAVGVPPVIRFFAALFFYATGSYQRTIGQNFNLALSQQSVSNAVGEVSVAIQHVLGNEWIKFPNTLRVINHNKGIFMEATRFPGIIGAIDCTHIAIMAPREEEHNYVNRKGFHSKNVQMVCDYNLKILNVNANYPGSTHDSFIWRQSAIQRILQNIHQNGNRSTWLVGDSGYPQQPYLMTPILHAAEGTPEFRYTEAHIRARNCIERCFGILKGRFRCLLKERVLRYEPNKVGIITNVCCILHNICVEGHLPNNMEMPPNEQYENVPVVDDFNLHNEGIAARQNLLRMYFEN